MKRHLLSILLLLMIPSMARAELDSANWSHLDVITTSEGSVLRGLIVEQVPGQHYKIRLAGGSVLVVSADKVVKLSKEPNPNFRRAPAPALAPAQPTHGNAPGLRASFAPPAAASGMRIALSPTLVMPIGDLDNGMSTSFGLGAFIGYERLFGNVGLSGGLNVSFVHWALKSELEAALERDGVEASFNSLALLPTAQVAFHFNRFVPYAFFGLGLDMHFASASGASQSESETNTGLGMELGFGARFLATPSFALGLEMRIHPGLTELVDGGVEAGFFGLGINAGYLF